MLKTVWEAGVFDVGFGRVVCAWYCYIDAISLNKINSGSSFNFRKLDIYLWGLRTTVINRAH